MVKGQNLLVIQTPWAIEAIIKKC